MTCEADFSLTSSQNPQAVLKSANLTQKTINFTDKIKKRYKLLKSVNFIEKNLKFTEKCKFYRKSVLKK